MDHRTQSQPEFGGLSGIMNDLEWIATSQNTLHSIDQLFRSMESENNVKYLVCCKWIGKKCGVDF